MLRPRTASSLLLWDLEPLGVKGGSPQVIAESKEGLIPSEAAYPYGTVTDCGAVSVPEPHGFTASTVKMYIPGPTTPLTLRRCARAGIVYRTHRERG